MSTTPTGPCREKYCNPIIIKFTNKGKQDHRRWLKGNTWGLQLYTLGKDHGLIFRIKLTVESSPPIPIGPNKVLPEQGPPEKPKLPAQTVNPLHTSAIPLSPSTIVPASPSTGQRLFNLVRGAYYALNRTDPEATTDCWLCLSSGPPY